MGDPTVPLRFPRYFSASSSSSTHIPPPPPQPYLYASPSRPAVSFPTPQFPQHAVNDYYVGHVLSSTSTHQNYAAAAGSESGGGSYTCIGAPVGQGFGGKDGSVQNQDEEGRTLNWGRSYSGAQHHRLDPASAINRFQDGF